MDKRIILFVIGGLLMFGLFGCSNNPNAKNKELISYAYSSGGDMTGGGNSTEISIIDFGAKRLKKRLHNGVSLRKLDCIREFLNIRFSYDEIRLL